MALAWLFLDDGGCGARMAWEMQGPGLVFGETVTQKLNYLNIYLRSQETSLERKVSDEPGWVPTSGNKTRLLEDYRKALETREFVNHSAYALKECHQFRYDQSGNVVHDKEQCDEESEAGQPRRLCDRRCSGLENCQNSWLQPAQS